MAAAQLSTGFVVWRKGEELRKKVEDGKGKSVFLTRCHHMSWAIWSPAFCISRISSVLQ